MSHRVSRALVLGLLLALATLPVGGQAPAGLPVPANAQERQFDSDGVEIRYLIAGRGDPVVLVHGFSASARTNWVLPGIFDTLAEDFMVIALDARGHGGSGKPHDPRAYGREMALDVVRLLDHLKIQQAHVVGYSMGGFLTLELLTIAPDRLLSAVLGGAGLPDPAGAATMEALADSLEKGEGILPLIEALQPVGGPPLSEEQKATWNRMVLAQNDPLALAAVIRGMGTLESSPEALHDVEVPVLAVIGSADPLKVGVDALAEWMPELQVVVLDGADHMTAIMDPGLPQAIRDFLVALCMCA